MNIQGFYTGREFDADTFFGAHPYEGGTHFAVWAPSARDVKVITSGLSDGSWAEWQMHRSYSGCWEADAAGVTRGTCYQYRVCGADGSVVDHCDPYGTAMTLRPDGRSIVWGAPTCQWSDSFFIFSTFSRECFCLCQDVWQFFLYSHVLRQESIV